MGIRVWVPDYKAKTESCDRKPVIDLQMPASRYLADTRNINQFQRLMSGHGAAKMRHTYTPVWRSTATPDYLHYNIYTSTVHSFVVPVRRARIERVLADQRQDEAQLSYQLTPPTRLATRHVSRRIIRVPSDLL